MPAPADAVEVPVPRRASGRGSVPGWTILRQVLARPAGVIGLTLTGSIVAVALLAHRIAPGDPLHAGSRALLSPSAAHRFGTDYAGRDMFTAVVHGVVTTMTVVFWAAIISAVIGLTLGAVAGYRGGLIDWVLLRITELFQCVPRFFLALLVLTLYGATERNIILTLGLTMWTLLARVVRAEVLSVRQRDYVEAARAAGSGGIRIVTRHVIPNIMPTAIVVIALNASAVILLEAGLAFLGLGDPYHLSLGQLVGNANAYFQQAWWLSVFPGVALLMAVLGINLLADALGNVFNPHGRQAAPVVTLTRRVGGLVGTRPQAIRRA